MTLTEVFALLAFIVSVLMLVATVINVTFTITWKISHDDKAEHNKRD